MIILGYGPVGDLIAIGRSRRQDRQQRVMPSRGEPPLGAAAKAYLRAFDRLLLTHDPEEMRRARKAMKTYLAAMLGGTKRFPVGEPVRRVKDELPDAVLPNIEVVRAHRPWHEKRLARHR